NTGNAQLDAAVTYGPDINFMVHDNGGIDTLDFSGSAAAQTLNLFADSLSNVLGGVYNLSISRASNIENARGGSGADIIYGNNGANLIYGNAGADYLAGYNGADNLWGGAGADQHIGGNDASIDYARYDDANHGNLTIRLDASNFNTGVAAGDTYVGIEGLVGGLGNDFVVGSVSNNYLLGSGGNDSIYGQGGNDYLSGDAGADNLWGGAGADVHVGGTDTGLDFARYDDANYGNLTIRLDGGANAGAVAAGDTYSGIEGLVGGLGSDVVIGNTLTNHLFGGGANDYIDGRAGSDFLTGGAGSDRFVFGTALGAANVDRIADFAHLADDIVLLTSIFTVIGGVLDATEFRVGAAVDANDYILYDSATGALTYDSNGVSAGGAIQFASVTAGTVLTIDDFVMM
ncbi:MAG: M10 family metallopeptidase C-terminal domain-containing protein, partial [Rhizobiaceae bacterium]